MWVVVLGFVFVFWFFFKFVFMLSFMDKTMAVGIIRYLYSLFSMIFNLSGLIPSTSKRNMFSAQNPLEMSLMLSWRPLSHETKHQLSQSLRKQKLISVKCKFKFGDSGTAQNICFE